MGRSLSKRAIEFSIPLFKTIAEAFFDAYQYIFGAEESYGYLFGTFVRDKDAISSACLIAEMAATGNGKKTRRYRPSDCLMRCQTQKFVKAVRESTEENSVSFTPEEQHQPLSLDPY